MQVTLKDATNFLSGNVGQLPHSSTALTNSLLRDGGLLDVIGGGDPAANMGNTICTNAQIDSRAVREGSIFFCLKGEHADGHDFASAAAKAGAVAVVASRDPFLGLRTDKSKGLPIVFIVDDPLRAMWRLALSQRALTKAHVIGITGSAGKTTVKEALAQVLSHHGVTSKNISNLNNQIGLPLSILNADNNAAYWVMESGISHAHDMDEIAAILQPDTSIILNVGAAHVEGLADRGVAYYKSRILVYTTPGGSGFVSADYPTLTSAVNSQRRVEKSQAIAMYTFSAKDTDNFSCARFMGMADSGLGKFAVVVGGKPFEIHAPFFGNYGAENVAVVAAVALVLGLEPEELQKAFMDIDLPKQRFARMDIGSTTLIDDSYNANPLSAGRMIDAATNLAVNSGKDLILVMGEMLELGAASAEHHVELGRTMAVSMPRVIFWKGGKEEEVRLGLQEANFQGEFYPVADRYQFIHRIDGMDIDDSIILFKGSRSNQLEKLVALFIETRKEKTSAL